MATPTPPQQPQKKKGGCLKWGAGIFGVLLLIGACNAIIGGETATNTNKTETVSVSKAPDTDTPPATTDNTSDTGKNADSSANNGGSTNVPREYKNALKSAENYLDFSGFSESGLRKQLEFEKFPPDAIDYALSNVKVDWNEEALDSAKSYDDFGSFSDDGLINQLLFEGFTQEQAEYAVNNL